MLIYGLFLSSYFLTSFLVSAFSPETRIVGGTVSARGQFPWQVIIKRDEDDELLCGGSIIASNWVLTAGHCTINYDSLYLLFGTIFLFDQNAVNMTSDQFFLHPQYNAENLNFDISLILLPQNLQYSNTIAPITLNNKVRNWIGTKAIIAGFGLTGDEILEYSTELLFGYVTLISSDNCTLLYGSEIVQKYTLCSNGPNKTRVSICSGDSGGPLITQDANGNDIQIGINSFVKQDACAQGFPAGYIDVGYFYKYIQTTMQQNS